MTVPAAIPTNSAPIVKSGIRRKAGFQVVRQRFAISEFINASGTFAYRVAGYRRDGARVRENYASIAAAQARQIELETEYIGTAPRVKLQATSLSPEQIRIAEVSFLRLGKDHAAMYEAVDVFLKSGKPNITAPRLDDAAKQFLKWVAESHLRPETRRNLRVRTKVFAANSENIPISELTAEHIERHLESLRTGAVNRDNHRRVISRFFSWCMERPRCWIPKNPCEFITIRKPERSGPPAVLTVAECERLLSAAEQYENGALVPYVALGLFAGLRPFEIRRLTWSRVNLSEREIRIEQNTSKLGVSRVVTILPALSKWLEAYRDVPFYPKNWRKQFDAVKAKAGIESWPVDVMRHTAISHHFRKHTSYGLAAEQFGNSEQIIKSNYQGRVTAAETELFYALMPSNRSDLTVAARHEQQPEG